jgi:hypothetical protein
MFSDVNNDDNLTKQNTERVKSKSDFKPKTQQDKIREHQTSPRREARPKSAAWRAARASSGHDRESIRERPQEFFVPCSKPDNKTPGLARRWQPLPGPAAQRKPAAWRANRPRRRPGGHDRRERERTRKSFFVFLPPIR